MKLSKQKPKFPGDLIQRHQKAVAKGKVPKHGLKEEKAELKLMKAVAKKAPVKKAAAKKK
jgi:hypothetical protein